MWGNVFVLLGLSAIIFVFLYFKWKSDKSLKGLSNYLKGSVSKFSFSPARFSGEYEGMEFQILLSLTNNDTAEPYLKIVLFQDFPFELTIYQKNAMNTFIISNFWNRIFSRLSQKKLDSSIFGNEFLVYSSEPSVAKNYLNNENIKNTIKELFNKGFSMLSIDEEALAIKKTTVYHKAEGDLEKTNILDTLSKLKLLAVSK